VKTIYVGNLPYEASEGDIRALFARHGNVYSVRLATDPETGRPRGFGFVRMDAHAAVEAIDALQGMDLGGRPMRVNEARQRPRFLRRP
jgi:RNA recognition motif-containing protein